VVPWTGWRSVDERATLNTSEATPEQEHRTLEVEADEMALRRPLENLLGNALEHGGSDMTVHVGPLDGQAGFDVTGDGAGIPPAQREEVVRPGYTTEDGGTGIGLASVARIAAAHGWEIRIGIDGGGRFEFVT